MEQMNKRAASYESFTPGSVIDAPSVLLTAEHLQVIRTVGGYTHPLFTDPDYVAANSLPGQPVPGEWTLFLLGGLAEQSGAFGDDVAALVAIDQVRFSVPATVGDTLRLEIEVIDRREVSSGRRGIVEFIWRARNQRDLEVVECRVSMLFRLEQT